MKIIKFNQRRKRFTHEENFALTIPIQLSFHNESKLCAGKTIQNIYGQTDEHQAV